jgi:long-chain fatty acid transport protein
LIRIPMKFKRILFIPAWFATVIPGWSNGFYVPVQAPEATARGNAWLATADTASAVYYNAAGLTQLTAPEVVVGAYGIRLGIEADTANGTYKNDDTWSVLPQIYGALPINDKLVAGFGINTPFGLATDWGSNTPFRQLAMTTELDYVTGWLVMAYEVTDTFSIGGGCGLHYADIRLTQGISPSPMYDSFEFYGDDEALSWTLSALWKPTEQHSFGLVYRSKTDFSLDGDARDSYYPGRGASLDFMTPATAAVGYAYRPCAEWSFEANLEWVNWEQLNTLTLSQGGGFPDSPLPFNWDSNLIYSIGGTRFFDGGWNVSAGYNYIENSQPDPTFNPGISDADRHWLSVGFGRETAAFTFNFAYQYAFSDRDVNNSPGRLADGTYKSRFNGLMLNCEWRF